MDFFEDIPWDELDLTTPNFPNDESQGAGRPASPLEAESPSSESDVSETTGLPLLRLCDVEPQRVYDRSNPTCIHYDFKLKVFQRGAGKKRSMQVDLLNKSDLVLAPSDLWDEQIQAHVESLLSDPEKFSAQSSYMCHGGTVSIKAKNTRSGLDDTFDGDGIPWSKVDQHLESLGILFRLRRMPIVVMVELTYHETATAGAAEPRQRKTATTKARAKAPSDAVFMTRVYQQLQCMASSCKQNSTYCLQDKNRNHHAIDRDTMRAIYDRIKGGMKEGETFADVQEIVVPHDIREKILNASKKRKANGEIDCRNCKTRTPIVERLEIAGNPEEKLEEYCTYNLNVQSDRYRNGMEAANRFAMDETLDLASAHQFQDAVKDAMVAKGVPLGAALRFVSGIAGFVESHDLQGNE
ncbi:hypothetical protein MY3957_006481 [Beauveria namnaoensis]